MSRVYLDANVYIYYLNDHPEFGRAADLILYRLEEPQHELCASLFTLSELLVLPLRTKDEFRVAWLKLFFQPSKMTLLTFSIEASSIYASLRAYERVKPLDALHLACAATAGIDFFITNDRSLMGLNVPGIGAVVGLDASF